MPGPLDGLIVVDSTTEPQGAITTMILADYGARVVKVEPSEPAGEPVWTSRARKAWDRGKWSVMLDLDSPKGATDLRQILAIADVYVTSCDDDRAGLVGLNESALRGEFPSLIQCWLSGYGTDGPHADRPAIEALVAARWGMMGEQRGHRPGPKFLGHPNVLYGTGLLAVTGILAAVRARRITGSGQRVDVSLLDSVLAQSPMNWWWNEKEASYLARSGSEEGFGRGRILLGLFAGSDGEYLMLHSGGEGGFKRVMDLLDLGEGVTTVVGEAEMGVPLEDHELELVRKVPDRLLTRPRDEWVELLHAADIAAVAVHRPGEPLVDDQVVHAGLCVEIDDPELGVVRQVGPPISFSDVELPPPTPAPSPGAQRDLVSDLVASTPDQQPFDTGATLGSSLEGIKVLDFASFFATAYGSKILSDLGADVIKIEPLAGDPMRPLPDPFEASQRGKRDLCIDLKSPQGREVALELVRQADVVMHNLRPGKAEKLGLGYEQLRLVNPNLIYCYLPGWGSTGPKAHLKSFAPLLSGFCGLLYEGAGVGNPPVRGVMGNEDYYNGFLGAVGTLLALEQRSKTGKGLYLESPQLHSALFATTHDFVNATGELIPTLQLDADQTGFSPTYRIYPASEGWVCLGCVTNAHLESLASVTGIDAALRHGSFDVTARLGTFIGASPAADVVERLEASGVPCEVVEEAPVMPDFLWDEWGVESQRVFEQYHDTWGWIREVGLTIHLSDNPGRNRGPGPLLGEHSREILAEAGLAAEQIDELMGTIVFETARGERDEHFEN